MHGAYVSSCDLPRQLHADDGGCAAFIVIAPVDTTVGWQAADILQTRVHVKLLTVRDPPGFPPFLAEWTNPALKLSEFTDGAAIDLFAPDDRCRSTCYDYGQFDCRCPTTLERTTVHVAGGPTTVPTAGETASSAAASLLLASSSSTG